MFTCKQNKTESRFIKLQANSNNIKNQVWACYVTDKFGCVMLLFCMYYRNFLIYFITVKEKFELRGDVSLETEDGTDIDEGETLNMLPKEEKVYVVI